MIYGDQFGQSVRMAKLKSNSWDTLWTHFYSGPDEDILKLNEMGVGKLFVPGTSTKEISETIVQWVKENRNF